MAIKYSSMTFDYNDIMFGRRSAKRTVAEHDEGLEHIATQQNTQEQHRIPPYFDYSGIMYGAPHNDTIKVIRRK